MKIKRLLALYAKAAERPAGYVEDVLSRATVNSSAGTYAIAEPDWAAMRAKYGGPAGGGDAVAPAPCQGCGDKRNVAQVKASPAAMEEMLRG